MIWKYTNEKCNELPTSVWPVEVVMDPILWTNEKCLHSPHAIPLHFVKGLLYTEKLRYKIKQKHRWNKKSENFHAQWTWSETEGKVYENMIALMKKYAYDS